jgi:hypothetical protein
VNERWKELERILPPELREQLATLFIEQIYDGWWSLEIEIDKGEINMFHIKRSIKPVIHFKLSCFNTH